MSSLSSSTVLFQTHLQVHTYSNVCNKNGYWIKYKADNVKITLVFARLFSSYIFLCDILLWCGFIFHTVVVDDPLYANDSIRIFYIWVCVYLVLYMYKRSISGVLFSRIQDRRTMRRREEVWSWSLCPRLSNWTWASRVNTYYVFFFVCIVAVGFCVQKIVSCV